MPKAESHPETCLYLWETSLPRVKKRKGQMDSGSARKGCQWEVRERTLRGPSLVRTRQTEKSVTSTPSHFRDSECGGPSGPRLGAQEKTPRTILVNRETSHGTHFLGLTSPSARHLFMLCSSFARVPWGLIPPPSGRMMEGISLWNRLGY